MQIFQGCFISGCVLERTKDNAMRANYDAGKLSHQAVMGMFKKKTFFGKRFNEKQQPPEQGRGFNG